MTDNDTREKEVTAEDFDNSWKHIYDGNKYKFSGVIEVGWVAFCGYVNKTRCSTQGIAMNVPSVGIRCPLCESIRNAERGLV